MSIETTPRPLSEEEFKALNEKAKSKGAEEGLDGIVSVREEALDKAGAETHEIEVMYEDGETAIIPVTDIGKEALTHTFKSDGLAVHGESWKTEDH